MARFQSEAWVRITGVNPALRPCESARCARHLAGLALGLAALLSAHSVPAQGLAADGLRVTAAADREVVVLSSDAGPPATAQPGVGGVTAQSYATASQRIHVVAFEGETFRAATPLDGPRSRIVFDPARRTFVPLLPSIRVAIDDGVAIDALAAALGATDVTVFESLGFAIVDLPDALHPADAVAQATDLLGRPAASVRLRGPRIEWR